MKNELLRNPITIYETSNGISCNYWDNNEKIKGAIRQLTILVSDWVLDIIENWPYEEAKEKIENILNANY